MADQINWTDDIFGAWPKAPPKSTPTKSAGGGPGLTGAIAGGTAAAVGLVEGVGSIITASFQAAAARYTGESEEQRREYNATLLDMQAEDTLDRADEAADDYMDEVGNVIGAQRAGYAAQGVKVGTGVSRAVEASTRATARENLARMRNRADLEASGIRTQSSFQRMAGAAARSESESFADARQAGGILGGASKITASVYKAVDEVDAINKFFPSSKGK